MLLVVGSNEYEVARSLSTKQKQESLMVHSVSHLVSMVSYYVTCGTTEFRYLVYHDHEKTCL